jgi:hypothetical protein
MVVLTTYREAAQLTHIFIVYDPPVQNYGRKTEAVPMISAVRTAQA